MMRPSDGSGASTGGGGGGGQWRRCRLDGHRPLRLTNGTHGPAAGEGRNLGVRGRNVTRPVIHHSPLLRLPEFPVDNGPLKILCQSIVVEVEEVSW